MCVGHMCVCMLHLVSQISKTHRHYSLNTTDVRPSWSSIFAPVCIACEIHSLGQLVQTSKVSISCSVAFVHLKTRSMHNSDPAAVARKEGRFALSVLRHCLFGAFLSLVSQQTTLQCQAKVCMFVLGQSAARKLCPVVSKGSHFHRLCWKLGQRMKGTGDLLPIISYL